MKTVISNIPLIQQFMTPVPCSIGFDMALSKAKELMRTYRIRHLPVKKAGKLVGIVTDRNLKFAVALQNDDALKIEDIMIEEPYVVTPNTPLDQVALEMAKHKYGCAIVESHGKVVGIFTATDGLRILGEMYSKSAQKKWEAA